MTAIAQLPQLTGTFDSLHLQTAHTHHPHLIAYRFITRSSTVAKVSPYLKASNQLPVAERKQFPRMSTHAILNATINARIQYGNLQCRQQLCIQNCSQITADRDVVTIDSL